MYRPAPRIVNDTRRFRTSVQFSVFHIGSRPHLFDVVEFPDFRTKYVDDNVAGVDEDPVSGLETFNPWIAESFSLEIGDQMIGDRADMAVRSPGDDYHIVSQRRLSGNVDGYNIFGLGIFEASKDKLKSAGGGISATFLAPWEAARRSSLDVHCCQSFSFP
jgi:hypothetical protein